MDDLKAIWQKVGDLKAEVGEMLEMDKVETIYTQLKKEEDRQKKWKPWQIPYVIAVTVFIFWVYNWISQHYYGRNMTTQQILGTLLIPIGGFIMLYFYQLHQIPLDDQHDRTSLSFLKMVKEKLAKRRQAKLQADMIYTALLTIGLNIISIDWGITDITQHWKHLLALNGIMAIIAIFSFINGQKKFDKRYKDILARIDRFLVE
ncbi:MAG: hypothetical protein AB8G86_25970 [Saprospiraceae bacterium]